MSIREATKTQHDGIRMHVLLLVTTQDLRKLQRIHLLARKGSGYCHTLTRFQPNRRESAGITEVTLVCRTFMSVTSPSERAPSPYEAIVLRSTHPLIRTHQTGETLVRSRNTDV